MTIPNPYAPTASIDDDNRQSQSTHTPSTWLRNFKAMVVVTTAYVLFCLPFALSGSAMPEALFVILFAIASVASAWANIPLGQHIGWTRGGLPVVVLVFFIALAGFCLTSLMIGSTLYGIIHPIIIYETYPL